MLKKLSKIISICIISSMLLEQTGFAQVAGQLDISSQVSVGLSNIIQDKFRPIHLRYLSFNPTENNFKLLLDKGSVKNPDQQLIDDTTKELLKYFLIGVTLPNDSFWVNLRPDATNEVMDEALAKTDVGKILIEADLQLKKDTAKYTSPQTPEGKEYWNKLYQKAEELYGTQQITIPTLNRPWIVPDEIIVRENQGSAYIYKATMKVMLEDDYLKGSQTYNFTDDKARSLNEYSSQLLKETIIPKITKEINSVKRYASLRQVYYSLILAQWFKSKYDISAQAGDVSSPRKRGSTIADSLSFKINSKNLTGLTSKETWSRDTYYQAYQKSFKDGEYNIKESKFTANGQVIRSYVSGGLVFNLVDAIKKNILKVAKEYPVYNKDKVISVEVKEIKAADILLEFDSKIGRADDGAEKNIEQESQRQFLTQEILAMAKVLGRRDYSNIDDPAFFSVNDLKNEYDKLQSSEIVIGEYKFKIKDVEDNFWVLFSDKDAQDIEEIIKEENNIAQDNYQVEINSESSSGLLTLLNPSEVFGKHYFAGMINPADITRPLSLQEKIFLLEDKIYQPNLGEGVKKEETRFSRVARQMSALLVGVIIVFTPLTSALTAGSNNAFVGLDNTFGMLKNYVEPIQKIGYDNPYTPDELIVLFEQKLSDMRSEYENRFSEKYEDTYIKYQESLPYYQKVFTKNGQYELFSEIEQEQDRYERMKNDLMLSEKKSNEASISLSDTNAAKKEAVQAVVNLNNNYTAVQLISESFTDSFQFANLSDVHFVSVIQRGLLVTGYLDSKDISLGKWDQATKKGFQKAQKEVGVDYDVNSDLVSPNSIDAWRFLVFIKGHLGYKNVKQQWNRLNSAMDSQKVVNLNPNSIAVTSSKGTVYFNQQIEDQGIIDENVWDIDYTTSFGYSNHIIINLPKDVPYKTIRFKVKFDGNPGELLEVEDSAVKLYSGSREWQTVEVVPSAGEVQMSVVKLTYLFSSDKDLGKIYIKDIEVVPYSLEEWNSYLKQSVKDGTLQVKNTVELLRPITGDNMLVQNIDPIGSLGSLFLDTQKAIVGDSLKNFEINLLSWLINSLPASWQERLKEYAYKNIARDSSFRDFGREVLYKTGAKAPDVDLSNNNDDEIVFYKSVDGKIFFTKINMTSGRYQANIVSAIENQDNPQVVVSGGELMQLAAKKLSKPIKAAINIGFYGDNSFTPVCINKQWLSPLPQNNTDPVVIIDEQGKVTIMEGKDFNPQETNYRDVFTALRFVVKDGNPIDLSNDHFFDRPDRSFIVLTKEGNLVLCVAYTNDVNEIVRQIMSEIKDVKEIVEGDALSGLVFGFDGKIIVNNDQANILAITEADGGRLNKIKTVKFIQVDSDFSRWVDSGGITPLDFELINLILSTDEATISKLLTQYKNKVYLNYNEQSSDDGRTVYLELDKPFKNIKLLKFKGIRPRANADGEVLPYSSGKGVVDENLRVDEQGNFIVLKPDFCPFGGLIKIKAENEYKLMQLEYSTGNTDYPISVGIIKNKIFQSEPIAFVVSGIEKVDERLNFELDYSNKKKFLSATNFKTGEKEVFSLEESARIYELIGKMLRMYHERGNYHRFPHLGNIGVKRDNKGKVSGVVLRDLDPTIRKETINAGEQTKKRISASWRFADMERLIVDVLYGKLKFIDSELLLESFLKGYFKEYDSASLKFKKIMASVNNSEFLSVMTNLGISGSSISSLKLGVSAPVVGGFWQQLYEFENNQQDNQIKDEDGGKGGIDFRILPILTQEAFSSVSVKDVSQINRLVAINLDQKIIELQKMVDAQMIPSEVKIKEYVQAACLKSESTEYLDKLLVCVIDMLKIEEEKCYQTNKIVKDLMLVLESGMSNQELKRVVTGASL